MREITIYGGYVSVPRHLIDFSSKTAVEAVLADLAAQYATEQDSQPDVGSSEVPHPR